MKVWTLLLEEWGVEYEEQALLALLRWAKNHGLDTTRGAALDINTWARTDRFIIKAASKGNESANKVLKPWKLILDLLRQLNTEVRGEDWPPDEVVGGMWRKRPDKTGAAIQCHCAALNRCPAPALCPGELDCTTLPCGGVLADSGAKGNSQTAAHGGVLNCATPLHGEGPENGGAGAGCRAPVSHGGWWRPAMRKSPAQWQCHGSQHNYTSCPELLLYPTLLCWAGTP